MAPSGGARAGVCPAPMVAASPRCWARRSITNPPTASAKTRTRMAPASCLAQFFIRPNNGWKLEKVRQAFPKELAAAGVVVGLQQLTHADFGNRDHGVDGLPGALDRRAGDLSNCLFQTDRPRARELHALAPAQLSHRNTPEPPAEVE